MMETFMDGFLFLCPVLELQAGYFAEVAEVASQDRRMVGQSDRGDSQIHRADPELGLAQSRAGTRSSFAVFPASPRLGTQRLAVFPAEFHCFLERFGPFKGAVNLLHPMAIVLGGAARPFL
jgi:hypothetical protein